MLPRAVRCSMHRIQAQQPVSHAHYNTLCNTLQHTLQHSAAHRNTLLLPLRGMASNPFFNHTNILEQTAAHCNILQHTLQRSATLCNALQHTTTTGTWHTQQPLFHAHQHIGTDCRTLQNIAAHCITLQHAAQRRTTLHHAAPRCTTLH